MEMKDDESQTLRLRVDQISSELDKQDRVRAVNTKWMLTVGAVIVAALGYTNFVQLPREAAKAAKEQVGPKIVDEANKIVEDLRQDKVYAQEIKKELGAISDIKKIANLPIGTIVPSMLEPSKFAEEVGDPNRTTWVLADGQKNITNSQYGQQYGQKSGKTTPPDLRGMFLRGMNVKGGADPDENRQVGSYQEDAFAKHDHKCPVTYYARHFARGDDVPWTAIQLSDVPEKRFEDRRKETTEEGSENETRPKNVAVYFYIKIN